MALTLQQNASSILLGQVAQQRFYTVSDPAAGSDYSITVPAGETWYLQGFKCILSTSATVATRFPILLLAIGANVVYYAPPSAGIAASLSDVFSWSPGLPGVSTSNINTQPCPDVPIQPGSTLITFTQNIQVGDQYSQGTLSILAYT